MKAKTFVTERQIAWARRNHIKLMVSPDNPTPVEDWDGKKTRTAYTTDLTGNLFEPMDEDARADFLAGDGGELGGSMQALYSSSAMACNLFHHLRKPENQHYLLDAIGLPRKSVQSIRFEQKRKVMDQPKTRGFSRDPNLDLVIRLDSSGLTEAGIECKFREPWSGKQKGLSKKYIDETTLWDGLAQTRLLAERIVSDDADPVHVRLHAAQLLKHLLGLRYENRAEGKGSFQLIYLFYDVPGDEGAVHLQELTEFARVVQADGIRFRWITCQELILRLLRNRSHFPEFLDYLTDRYL